MRVLLLSLALGALGCSGLNRVVKPPPQPLELTTVFVYPVTLNGMERNAPRVFELSQRALDRAVTEGGEKLAFYGPLEFKVMKPEVDNAWVATDAIPVLVRSGSRPDQGAALRITVERRVASSSTLTETKKGAKATMTIVPVAAPDKKVPLDISLKGFTAGFDAVQKYAAK